MRKVLVLNSGSSSIKYQLFDIDNKKVLAIGLIEKIGDPVSILTHELLNQNGELEEYVHETEISNHQAGIEHLTKHLEDSNLINDVNDLIGIGHRVVHGGEQFKEPTLITEPIIEKIREQIPLAPLHKRRFQVRRGT